MLEDFEKWYEESVEEYENKGNADEIARKAMLLVCIPDVLYMCRLTRRSAIFVERVDGMFRCYRLDWVNARGGGQRIHREKEYIKGSLNSAMSKAKRVISWYENMRAKK